MTTPDRPTTRSNDDPVEDVLEAFNAGEVVERPGEPPRAKGDPTSDTDVQPPG